jgi:hypothetical protein
MKTLKEILAEARFVSSGAYRISPSGRKVRRRIKIADDDYNKVDDVDKDGDVDADDAKRLKMMQREDTIVESIYGDDYHATSEPSQFGGHRPKVVHKEKGTVMHLSQHSYKKPEDAAAHAKVYLDAYERRGPNHASEKAWDHAKANKDKQYVKESHAPEAPSIGVHRIGVTVSEPDHPAVTKRNELIQKFVRVTSHDKDHAIEQGKKHFKKKGFKVHDASHAGMMHEAKTDDVPFDGPYTKTPETVKDKSGAEHNAMSRARHIARLAMKQVAKQPAKKNNEQ